MARNVLKGDAGDNTLYGSAGDDLIYGKKGNDLIFGANGDDIINGDDGQDTIHGGAGNDELNEASGYGIAQRGSGALYGEGGNDRLRGSSGETLDGGAGDDLLAIVLGDSVTGDLSGMDGAKGVHLSDGTFLRSIEAASVYLLGENNYLKLGRGDQVVVLGGGGQDHVVGGSGRNIIHGGAGTDILAGHGGDDLLGGGAGADVLTGGDGSDTFQITLVSDSTPDAPDLITDLESGDRIDLSAVDADTTDFRNSAFKVVEQFRHKPGELVISYSDGDHRTLISGDVDGDGTADLLIAVEGDHADFQNFVL